MAVHGELRPDDRALPLLVASAALSKAGSAMTRPTGSVRIDNGDGTETWLGEAASETGGVVQWVNDTTPPARPIGVTATCQMGVVVAAWAGELEEPIPADFSHVEVFAQKDGSSDVVDAGMLYGAGSVTLTGFAEGDIVDVWAVAYDDAHDESGVSKPNASGKSDIATVVVEPVVSQQQLAAKADEILNAGKAYSDQLNSQIQTDMSTAKKSIDSNTDAVKAAQQTADDAKTSVAQTANKVTSLDSSLTSVKSTLDSTASKVATQGNLIDSANASIAALQKTADGKNTIYAQEDEPSHTGLKPGDLWFVRSNYRTYWQGEPNASPSVMEIPSSRIRGIKIWDGSTFVDYVFRDAVEARKDIDANTDAVKAAQQAADDAKTSIAQTASKVTSLDSSLASVKSTLDSTAKDVAAAKKAIDSNTNSVKAAQQAADDAKTSIAQTASKVTSIDSSLASTQSKVNSLDKSLSAAQSALDSANTSIAQTANKVDSIDSSLSSAKSKLDSLDSSLSSTQNKVSSLDSSLSSVKGTLDSTVSKVSVQGSVLDKANASIAALQKTADGKNTIYIQETEPAHTALRPGDLWYLRSNYRTYWQGEPNASPSVMEIPSSRIRGIKIWDGSTFVDYVFVADKIVAENSVTTGLLAADAIYGKVLKGGEFITTNGRLKINDAGLVAADSNGVNTLTVDANSGAVSMLGSLKSGSTVSGATVTGGTIQTTAAGNRGVKLTSSGLAAYDTSGNPTLAVDASTGAVSMKGALKSGSTVSGATITGGTVDANEYQLHSGSTLVGKANSNGVYFGDSMTYAKSGTAWKLSLKNAGLQASTVDGCTVTGGTVTGSTVQTTADANRGVKITSGGLAAYDANGNPTLAVDAASGAVSMKGSLMSGSTVSGAAVTGGTVDAAEYQLHSGSTLVGKANSSGVYFGDALTYAKSGSTWKLSLKNAGLQASTVDGCTVTGGTVTGATVQTTSTANRGVKITSSGLAAYYTNGNPTLAVDAGTGSVSMLGTLKSGSTVSGAAITGGTVDAAEYQLHSGSELVGKANSSGVYFGDSLTYAKSGSAWKLSLKNAGLQASTVDGCTVTGGTIQTTTAGNRGVKITSGGLAAYDKNGAATLTVDADSGSILMKGAVSTNSTLNAPAINSGTVTGAVIQTTAAANRGVKLTGSALQAWDDNGNQTLDLNGSTNTMTGTFRTADNGARIELSNTTSGGAAIGKLSGLDKYGNVNWLVQGDITGDGIYGNGDNAPDPLDTTVMHLGVSEQNPEISIIGWGNGYRQISMGADRVDFTSSSVSGRTRVPDAGIYINGLRIDPYYVTDISKILTFENSDWSEYKGAGGNDPHTRLLIVGNLRFLTLGLQCKYNINSRWCAGTILPEHLPANGINAAAAMTGGGVGDAYIIGRNVDSGALDAQGNAVKAGQIYIDPVSDYVNKSCWFCATFIYQV